MKFITSTDAAERIGIHPTTAAMYAAEWRLPKSGRYYIWTEDDVQRGIKRHAKQGDSKFNGGKRGGRGKAISLKRPPAPQMVQPRQQVDYVAEIRARNARGEVKSTFSPDVYDPRSLLQQARATAQAARGKNG